MNSLFPGAWLRLWAGVLLALGAGGVLAPRALAGCDYDVIASRHADVASTNALTKLSPPSSVPERRPCSGPHCSSSPRTPLLPPAPPVVSVQDWAYIPAAEQGTRPDGFAYRLEDCRNTPIIHRYRIFHPPR